MSRQLGKSHAQKMLVEAMLDAGETVAVVSRLGVVIYKRKKHLTCMELRK
jgi:hypothetical protein